MLCNALILWGKRWGMGVKGVWSVVERNSMYVPGRAAVDQRGVGGRWGSQVTRSSSSPPHAMAVRSMQRSPEGRLCVGLGHPSPERSSRCTHGPCSAQHRRGRGGCFPAPYLASPSLASLSAMDCSRSCTVRSVLSSISICSVNSPAVLPSSSLARTLTLSVVAVSASFSKR